MITLFCIESQMLNLLLIFLIVKHCLWQDHIAIDVVIEVKESGPAARVDLHDIEHDFILHTALYVHQILSPHSI